MINLVNNIVRHLPKTRYYGAYTTTLNQYPCISQNRTYARRSMSTTTSISSQPNCPPSQKSNDPPGQQEPEPPQNNNNFKYIALSAITAIGGAIFYYIYNKNEKIDETPKKKVKSRVPATSSDIPKEVPYLLIGGGTASFSAFRAIKSHDPKAKVLVITNERNIPYMRPPLSKELWFYGGSRDENAEILKFKQWNGVERSLYYEPDDFYIDPKELNDNANGGVSVVRGYTVKEIDVCNKEAILEDGTKISYGECLIATGSSPRNIDAFNNAPKSIKDKVTLFKTIDDYEYLRNKIKNIKSIAIIGGGFLGSELSCALVKNKENNQIKVYQLFYETGNMGKVLPEYLSNWTTDRVKDEGVNVMPKSQIKSVTTLGDQVKLELIDGRFVLVDHVVVAVGSDANTDLAAASKLEVDRHFGGFVVNAELEARRHLFVAGDAACFYDPQLGRRRVEHHDHAVVSGRLAGENMVGLKKPYLHQSMFWSDLGPLVGYEAIGLIDSSLPTVGVFAKQTDNDIPSSSNDDKLTGIESTNIKSLSVKAHNTKVVKSDDKTIEPVEDDFGKGIIFYLRDDKVVGILLWNVFNRINIARKVIAENKKFDDLNEVAKLFDIHEQT